MQREAWRALLLAASGAALYMGPDSCPCLTTHASERLRSLLSSSTYGLGCAPHDVDLSKCANQRALCDTVARRFVFAAGGKTIAEPVRRSDVFFCCELRSASLKACFSACV